MSVREVLDVTRPNDSRRSASSSDAFDPAISNASTSTARSELDRLNSAFLIIESRDSTWVFDEENHRFQRILRDQGRNLEVSEWRSYDRLITDDTTDAFLVFLDKQGSRMLRSRREGANKPGVLS